MMDENNILNKDMAGAPKTVKAADNVELTEYHFAGSGKYRPMTILAAGVNEATELWKEKRELVEPLNQENNNK